MIFGRVLVQIISVLFLFCRYILPGRDKHQVADLTAYIVPAFAMKKFTHFFCFAEWTSYIFDIRPLTFF